jgi:2-dehydro-3-deoxyphosphogluconate aldolase/(4S)-4-hydroxy-2-oxoglutarate aldolase
MIPDSLAQQIEAAGLIAVLQVDEAAAAVPLARALLAGGVQAMELTLRTEAAIAAVERICSEVPEMQVGVGTILTPEQAQAAHAAGAGFGVAPGSNPRVIAAARDLGLPFAPGVCTPTEMERALELDCRLMKFFPAEPTGGLAYLRSAAAPLTHLGVRFLPLGGIHAGNLAAYLKDPLVLAVGGSWIAPRQAIREAAWETITAKAREATALVETVRGEVA